jgi:hypothetical protein
MEALLRDALKIIRKIFPFMDQNSVKKDQYEFYKQLGLVPTTPLASRSTPPETGGDSRTVSI